MEWGGETKWRNQQHRPNFHSHKLLDADPLRRIWTYINKLSLTWLTIFEKRAPSQLFLALIQHKPTQDIPHFFQVLLEFWIDIILPSPTWTYLWRQIGGTSCGMDWRGHRDDLAFDSSVDLRTLSHYSSARVCLVQLQGRFGLTYLIKDLKKIGLRASTFGFLVNVR